MACMVLVTQTPIGPSARKDSDICNPLINSYLRIPVDPSTRRPRIKTYRDVPAPIIEPGGT